MVTEQDILDELQKKTETGRLEWHTSTGFWSARSAECRFLLNLNGQLSVTYTQKGLHQELHINKQKATETLLALLQEKFPYPEASRDEKLRHALECLTDH